jgi:hypothetical protein
MIETFGDLILRDRLQMLKFVKTTLMDNEEASLFLGLTLLNQLFNFELDDTSENDDTIYSTINDIKIILQTLLFHESLQIRALANSAILKLSSKATSNQFALSEKRFNDALLELGDELLPIRAHGMSQLKHLVIEKDPVAVANVESILTIFLDFINDEDR